MNQMPEILTQKNGRPYVQLGGPLPSNDLLFYGGQINYVAIGGVSIPVRGSIDPVYVHDPYEVGAYVRAARTMSAPDLPTSDLMFREMKGGIPRQLLGLNCELNVYLPRGSCAALSQFDLGWDDYVLVFSRGLITSRDLGDVFTFDGDDPIETTLNVTWDSIYPIGRMGFSRVPITVTRNNITDATFGNRVICGQCGPADDGTGLAYFLEAGNNVGSQYPRVLYRLVDGGALTSVDITAAATSEAPSAIAVMGQYLVVISPTANGGTSGGLYYALISPITGVPGTFVKVVAGFTNGREPRDIVVLNEQEAYVCCDGGEILKIENPAKGATSKGIVAGGDLVKIDAVGDTIVAVGPGGVVVSQNRGRTFGVTDVAPGSEDPSTVAVMSNLRWWVGLASGGGLWYTLDGGNTWAQSAIPSTDTPTIDALAAGTQEALYVAFYEDAPGFATSINGGVSWIPSSQANPRVQNFSDSGVTRFSNIAVPRISNAGVAANNVIVTGDDSSGNGYVAIGAGNTF